MWLCKHCGTQCEDQFEACWKCGKDKTADDASTDTRAALPAEEATARSLACGRCKADLEFAGTKRFHEGSNWGVFGELGELFVKRERFDVYVCTKCGHVEFFVDGAGEEFRPQ